MKDGYDGTQAYDEKFAKLWRSIGEYFAEYPQSLPFKVINEPERAFGDFSGTISPYTEKVLALTRKINEVGYAAI